MLFGAGILACLSLVQAVPTSVAERDLTELVSRATPEQFRDQLPGCGDDPSYSTQKSGYKKDQGVKVPREGKNDACNDGSGNSAGHCWTEYWIVESEVEYNNWVNTGSAIDCKSTSRCTSTDIDLGQTCASYTVSHSDGGEWKILDVAVDGKIFKDWGLKVGGSISYKWDNTKANQQTACTSQSARNQCSWEDDKCHQVWYAQRDVRLHGYAMRVCNGKNKKGDSQMNEQRADGKWVRGMEDFSFRLPINKLVGCNGWCEQTTYPEPVPEEPGRHPFTADW
ncbi:hypothetical protein F4818DRAFT_189295 [Hypoxylon cercidicola]|nr:hypothetical protein F4818DRAFT_189295 [Hypoxylon cercidicola]